MRASLAVVFAGAMVLAVAWAPVKADDPVSTSVSFNREIIRIIQRKCEPCHAPGGLAMSLSDYRDARAWGRAIREELVAHRMPPAMVARGYGRYETDPGLNAREIATFLTWLDGGMPRGDEADRPPAPAVEAAGDIGEDSGVRLPLPAQTLAPSEDLVVRRVAIDAGAAAGRAIARVQLRPGNRRVLRGAMVFVADRSLWLGAWLPWQHAIVPPSSYAFHIPAGASLFVDLYYRGADVEMTDRSALELTFAPAAARGAIDDIVVDASGPAGSRVRGSVTLSQPATVWAIHPALDASAKSIELRAERPDKSFEVLLWIPEARADWPVALVLQEPVTLPAGSTLSLVVETRPGASAASPPRVTLSVLR